MGGGAARRGADGTGRRERGGAVLSGQADPPGPPVQSRRHHRLCRPHAGQHLGEPLGQPVVAENRPGAGGIAGTDAVARAAADGYTLVLMDPAIVINPTLQPSLPYDLFKQLQTVSSVSSSPEVLVVSPHLPGKSSAELVSQGKASPAN